MQDDGARGELLTRLLLTELPLQQVSAALGYESVTAFITMFKKALWMPAIPRKHFAPGPTMLYGVILLLAAIAYWLLQHTILLHEGAVWDTFG